MTVSRQLHEYDYVQLEDDFNVEELSGKTHFVPSGTMCQVQSYHEYGVDVLTKEGVELYATYDQCSPMDAADAASYHGYDVR